MKQRDLTKKERIRIAKSCDLYRFGVSLFELMIFKSSQAEFIEAKNRTNTISSSTDQLLSQPNIMPLLDSIPLNWVKMVECACLIEIIHQCMVVETQRDTVALFCWINQLATQ